MLRKITYPCSMSVREKYWTAPHDPEPIPTGNYEVSVHDSEGVLIDIDHIVPICRLGGSMAFFEKTYKIKDAEIERIWNANIEFHNKHNGFFIYAFSVKHKKYLRELFPFYGDERLPAGKHQPVVLWEGEADGFKTMLVRETEKALLLILPEIGAQWIPKSQIYVMEGRFYCVRKGAANSWHFGALDMP